MLRSHAGAFFVALLIGFIYGLPHIFFMLSLGAEYKGVPMLQTPNEDSYLARIQEIRDGHGALGSPFFFEYKDAPPLAPPTGEWLYALPSLVFNVSPSSVLMSSKFILPPVLFLLIYALMFRLTGSGSLPSKWSAIACGLLIVLGYDLVDYRSLLSYLSGDASPGSFLLWARPVNPILGAIFLFSFLNCVFLLVRGTERQKSALFAGGVSLALMFASYFFSWGIALSVLAALCILFLLRKEYRLAGRLSLIVPIGIALAAPYWYAAWGAGRSPLYEESVLRSGLFLTHYPLQNKLLVATLAFCALVLCFDAWLKRRKGLQFHFEIWHVFTLALLLGGLWAYSQQIVTGRTIWPYHFVQYTIPLSIVVFFALLHHIVREWNRYVWGTSIIGSVAASLIFGVYVQASTYENAYPRYVRAQAYVPLFERLNAEEKDCVVLTNESSEEMAWLNTLVPAFTHCNRYTSTETFSLMPFERGFRGYLALLRLRGIASDDIETYLVEHRGEASGYLYSNWQGLFGVSDFPDFSDPLLATRLAAFGAQYREFLAQDFKTGLLRYRIDYILSASPLDEYLVRELRLTEAFDRNGLVLYSFSGSGATSSKDVRF